jgi:hypothetical protein
LAISVVTNMSLGIGVSTMPNPSFHRMQLGKWCKASWLLQSTRLQIQTLRLSVLAPLPKRLNSSPWYDARLVQPVWSMTLEFRVHR